VIRVAAVGDVHFTAGSAGRIRPHLAHLPERADVLLLAGDLTQHGRPEEGQALAAELAEIPVPVVAVLGNHDYHAGSEDRIRASLEEAGVRVLERESTVLDVRGRRLGIAGVKGFGGGFAGACGSEFGEPEMKMFARTAKDSASRLRQCLEDLACDLCVALTHYAPIEETLMGERLEIYPFLGSYLLGEAIDQVDCDLAIHGHAHRGSERGVTAGGVPVRNVARPVIRHTYRVYDLAPRNLMS
jgi:Icc-related predicted phosphoesterase